MLHLVKRQMAGPPSSLLAPARLARTPALPVRALQRCTCADLITAQDSCRWLHAVVRLQCKLRTGRHWCTAQAVLQRRRRTLSSIFMLSISNYELQQAPSRAPGCTPEFHVWSADLRPMHQQTS